jgi:hypothetical protein
MQALETDLQQLHPSINMSFQLPPGMRPAQPPGTGGGGGGGGPSNPNGGGQGQSEEGQREAQDKARAQEEMKRGMIASMLAPEARERCE